MNKSGKRAFLIILASISPWRMRQVARAVELGLGTADSPEVELLAATLDQDSSFVPFTEKIRNLMG